MTTVHDYEHAALARLIDNVARTAHAPDDCETCASLDIRRHLHGLAEQVRGAVEKVNGTPHTHGPKSDPQPQQDPPPEDPPPPKPGEGQ